MQNLKQYIKDKIIDPIKGDKFNIAIACALGVAITPLAYEIGRDALYGDKIEYSYTQLEKELSSKADVVEQNMKDSLMQERSWFMFNDLVDTLNEKNSVFHSSVPATRQVELLKDAVVEWRKKRGPFINEDQIEKAINFYKETPISNDFRTLQFMIKNAEVINPDRYTEEGLKQLEKDASREKKSAFSMWRMSNSHHTAVYKDEVEFKNWINDFNSMEVSLSDKIDILQEYSNEIDEDAKGINSHRRIAALNEIIELDTEIEKILNNDVKQKSAQEIIGQIKEIDATYISRNSDGQISFKM